MSVQYTRQPAVRVFAREFEDATHMFREGDDDRSPRFALLPTGGKANRIAVIGTLTETEDVGESSEYWRGRVVDPTGTFNIYAGEYEPEQAAKLREVDTPKYVAVIGKPNSFEGDEGEVYTNLRTEEVIILGGPESGALDHRQRWIVEAARQTLDRIEEDEGKYVDMAEEEYDGDRTDYADAVIEALEELEDSD